MSAEEIKAAAETMGALTDAADKLNPDTFSMRYRPEKVADKLKAFEQAKQDIEIKNRTLNPMMAFRVGDTIFITGLANPAHNGLYKVCEVTAQGVRYRQLRWYEKAWHVTKTWINAKRGAL